MCNLASGKAAGCGAYASGVLGHAQSSAPKNANPYAYWCGDGVLLAHSAATEFAGFVQQRKNRTELREEASVRVDIRLVDWHQTRRRKTGAFSC